MSAAPPRKPAGVAGRPAPNTLRGMVAPNTLRTARRPGAPEKATPAGAPVTQIRLPSARTLVAFALLILVVVAFLIQILVNRP